jgi:hypothetical protein
MTRIARIAADEDNMMKLGSKLMASIVEYGCVLRSLHLHAVHLNPRTRENARIKRGNELRRRIAYAPSLSTTAQASNGTMISWWPVIS